MTKGEEPAWACLCFRPDVLEVTTRFDPPADQKPQTHRIPGDPEEALAEWRKEVPEVRNLAVAVPTRDVLMIVTDLPSVDAGDLAGMVELQAEEISPFPPERTQVAWEVLRELGAGASRVLMVLMSQQNLEPLHDLLLPVTGLPTRLDVEVMGWLEMLLVNGHLSSGRDTWVVLLTGEDATLVAWHGETPVLIRSLGLCAELDAEVVMEELHQARVNVETAFPRARMVDVQLWSLGDPPDWVHDPSLAGSPVQSLAEFAPATHGVLVRSQLGYLLDLTPESWKKEEAMRRTRRKALRIGGALAAAWLLVLGGLVSYVFLREQGVKRLEAANLENAEAVQAVRELSDQVRSLSQFTDRRRGALESLRLYAEAAPGIGNLRVEDYRYRKGGGQVFSGEMGGDVQPFYRFLDALTGSDLLEVVDYDLQQTRDGYEFRLEADWRWGVEP